MELEYLTHGLKIPETSVFYSDPKQNLWSLFVPFVKTLVGTCSLAGVLSDVNNKETHFLRVHISLSSEMIIIVLKQMFVKIASLLSVLHRSFCACTSFFFYENFKNFLWILPQKTG